MYIMAGHTHVFGRKPTFQEREMDRERERKGKRPLKVDTYLSAPDLLVRHLLIRRDTAVPEQPRGQGTMTPKQRQIKLMHKNSTKWALLSVFTLNNAAPRISNICDKTGTDSTDVEKCYTAIGAGQFN